MDPASALGVAASIVELTRFTADLLHKANEVRSSADGALVENRELEAITTTLQGLSDEISKGSHNNSTKADKKLKELCDGCQDVTGKLLELLQKLKGSNSHHGWNSFRQAALSVWKEKEVRALSDRVERYRRQMDTIFLVILNERLVAIDPKTTLPGEFPPNQMDAWKRTVIDELRQKNLQHKNEQDMDTFSAYFTESAGQYRDLQHKRRILGNLLFNDIADRHERIEEAHRRTFEWISSESSSETASSCSPNILESSKNLPPINIGFVDWLRSDQQLFWITGKPGAGKSTLMKYIYNDPRTSDMLQPWIGADEFITGSFFFWNSGTVMQMSQEGLLRAVLHQALQDRLEDIPSHFPDRWKRYQLFGADPRPWALPELKSAFESLVSDNSKKFLLVIDGLDEFDGNCAELATWIIRRAARPNVKLCVASRPWPEFDDAFKSLPSLRVEDLTASDMRIFITETLQSNEMFCRLQQLEPKNAQSLMSEVLEKAAGVFLWVRLVVMSLLDGLRDGDTVVDLQVRLQRLPPDLEKLFQKIIDGLNPEYRVQASHMIRVVLDWKKPLALLPFLFMEHSVEEAISMEFKPLDSEATRFQEGAARRRLKSRCKGLLEASNLDTDGPDATVQFLHRTVRDFVLEKEMNSYILGLDETFDPYDAVCASHIICLKSLSVDGSASFFEGKFKDLFLNGADSTNLMRTQDAELKAAAVVELERIGNTFATRRAQILPPSDSSSTIRQEKDYPHCQWVAEAFRDTELPRDAEVMSFFCFATQRNLLPYIRKTVSMYPINNPTPDLNPLHVALDQYLDIMPSMTEPTEETIKVLLEHGAKPNLRFSNTLHGTPWRTLKLKINNGWPGGEAFLVSLQRVVELMCKYGAFPTVHAKNCSYEELQHRCNPGRMQNYYRVDDLTGGRLTSFLGSVTKVFRR
ncbi:hypothetical protein BK809_0002062 [Diplodia seriata]|uniref:NACHT domain-containing protein n=1 Tax=Diplodia seriata TaxID=420778 RepID=A0A1S8BEM8_9PEZI|nr:hypothetical protein BK809_0002062 [Diplodia seriata]